MAVAKEQIRQIIAENNINSVADVYRLSLNYVFRTAPDEYQYPVEAVTCNFDQQALGSQSLQTPLTAI